MSDLTEHRYRWAPAHQLATSISRRDPASGEPRTPKRLARAVGWLSAVLYVASPAVRIAVHPDGASARLTHLSAARYTAAGWGATGVVALVVLVVAEHSLAVAVAAVVLPVTAGVVGITLTSLWIARAMPAEATDLLSDLTRHPGAVPGAGGALLDQLAASDGIVGVAANRQLWERVYQNRARPVGRRGQRTLFQLDRTVDPN